MIVLGARTNENAICVEMSHFFKDCPLSFSNRVRQGREESEKVDAEKELRKNDDIEVNLNIELADDLTVSTSEEETTENLKLASEVAIGPGEESLGLGTSGSGEGSSLVVPETGAVPDANEGEGGCGSVGEMSDFSFCGDEMGITGKDGEGEDMDFTTVKEKRKLNTDRGREGSKAKKEIRILIVG